jgi:hypothetical protein
MNILFYILLAIASITFAQQPSNTPPTRTTLLTKFSVLPVPFPRFSLIPLFPSDMIARWRYFSDIKCSSSAYLGKVLAVHSEYEVCKPLLGNSIYIDYMYFNKEARFGAGSKCKFLYS